MCVRWSLLENKNNKTWSNDFFSSTHWTGREFVERSHPFKFNLNGFCMQSELVWCRCSDKLNMKRSSLSVNFHILLARKLLSMLCHFFIFACWIRVKLTRESDLRSCCLLQFVITLVFVLRAWPWLNVRFRGWSDVKSCWEGEFWLTISIHTFPYYSIIFLVQWNYYQKRF